MTPTTPDIESEKPLPEEGVGVGALDSQQQKPGPEAQNSTATRSPDSPTLQDLPTLTPLQADALAAALITTRLRHEIAAEHNLSLAQLGLLARTPLLTDRVAAINDLFTLQNAAIRREQIDRLRVIANTSESAIEARRASMAILTQLVPPRRAAHPARSSEKPLPEGGVGVGACDSPRQQPRPEAPSSRTNNSSQTSTTPGPQLENNSAHATPALPPSPPPPPPDTDADRLLAYQLKRFRDAKPATVSAGFNAIYEYCSHSIKMGGEARARFLRRLESSLLLAFLDHTWEQLPADKSERITRTPSPNVPDHRPLQTAIARIVIRREPTPVSIRFLLHLEQPYPRYEPNWAIEDVVFESG